MRKMSTSEGHRGALPPSSKKNGDAAEADDVKPIVDMFIRSGHVPSTLMTAQSARSKSFDSLAEQHADKSAVFAIQKLFNNAKANITSDDILKGLSDWEAVLSILDDIFAQIEEESKEGNLKLDFLFPKLIAGTPFQDSRFVLKSVLEILRQKGYHVAKLKGTKRTLIIRWDEKTKPK